MSVLGRRPTHDLPTLKPGDVPSGRKPYVLVVPGQAVPVVNFDLPAGISGAARRRIARQQLADRLGTGTEDLFLAPCDSANALWTRALVCDASLRSDWLADPLAKDKGCRAVLPAYLALPAAEDLLSVEAEEDTVHVRLGLDDGFSAPAALAADLIARALAGRDLKYARVSDDVPESVKRLVTATGLATATQDVGARFAAGELAADLRASDKANPGAAVGLMLTAMLLAVLAFALWSASLVVETRALQEQTAGVRASTNAMLRAGPIPDGPILDIRQQVTRALAERSGSSGPDQGAPLTLFSRATVALFGSGAHVSAVDYAPETGLAIDVSTTDFAAIDALVAELRAAGMDVSTTGLRSRDQGGAAARLILAASPEAQP